MANTKNSSRHRAVAPSLMDLVQPYLTQGDAKPTDPDPRGAALTLKWAGRGIRGRPWTKLRALAQENSVEAMARIVSLMDCDNPCVQFGASRAVLEWGHGKLPLIHIGESAKSEPSEQGLKVQIMRFKEEKKSGAATRDNKLPMVRGRRKGPRDTGDGDGA